ncbi:hypothetical protein [Nitratireductor luteus]|uniref:hypothetical protein n=1 Tax=Nitratireductor luteus TaxID=2976980 RepID=UPI002240D5E5|nr:hypothetical protein [Nitratireductor luteus]
MSKDLCREGNQFLFQRRFPGRRGPLFQAYQYVRRVPSASIFVLLLKPLRRIRMPLQPSSGSFRAFDRAPDIDLLERNFSHQWTCLPGEHGTCSAPKGVVAT